MRSIEAIPAWKTRRKILGMSAILLPYTQSGEIDWPGFRAHVQRTLDAGLVPAVNMDTGYANLIDSATRLAVLQQTEQLCAGNRYVGGAFVGDAPGSPFQADLYQQQIELIQQHSGTPILFQSYGLTGLDDERLLDAYRRLGAATDQFLAFELGQMFAPFGKIYSASVYRELVRIPQCLGAKHSSLDRGLEWERLAIRDALRPEFHVLTGNDLAIDMVVYGSDYLLGLSTLAPDVFAERDRLWLAGDARFFEVNDWLQCLGCFAFRTPVPAYKHSAAQFMHLRGWIASDRTHPHSPTRPDSDREILSVWLEQMP